MQEIFESVLLERKFLSAVKKAARMTFETGHESGFLAWRKADSRFFSNVVEGGCNSISFGEALPPKGIDDVVDEVEFSFHFHPSAEPDAALWPSWEDLESLSWMKGVAIGCVDLKGNIEVLFIWERSDRPLLPSDRDEDPALAPVERMYKEVGKIRV